MHKNVISWPRMIVIVKGVRIEKSKESLILIFIVVLSFPPSMVRFLGYKKVFNFSDHEMLLVPHSDPLTPAGTTILQLYWVLHPKLTDAFPFSENWLHLMGGALPGKVHFFIHITKKQPTVNYWLMQRKPSPLPEDKRSIWHPLLYTATPGVIMRLDISWNRIIFF